jgi:hypothetical protein
VKRGLAPLLLLAALGCKKKSLTTPAGTEILGWDAARATRRSVALARELEARKARDMKVVARPERKGPVTIALHVETAPLELVEGGKTLRRGVPVVVRATVEANADWTLTGKCWDGPEDTLPTRVDGKVVPSDVLRLTCRIRMTYQDTRNEIDAPLILEVRGDGTTTASLPEGAASIE